jgi:virulence-associated protein VagC
VRLPRACRFPDGETEVPVHREGRRVVLEPPDEWPASFLRCLGSLAEDIERPRDARVTKLRDPFG